ncbi:leucine-rich repeat-containing protein 72-like [Xenia sp. Carnegie-2017]|uniref:leucine-rich repeat-containing protein 72-like n=1 Tax=Xenia sp. Carnegie-2017 TaxID=2897299 RepID=UPI001F0452DE|nr:leucine-rich repeat-containing protein 72-like [Xenia sp. Carnegie-2017]
MSEKVDGEQRQNSKTIRQNQNVVVELYFGLRGLQQIDSLGKFKNLQRLWLNQNKLRKVDCLHDNFRLTELYLQHNLLVSITGCLRHLTELQVLMLQGNQLKYLTEVIQEFVRMHRLRVLNLFGNPLAQDYCYRNYVINGIRSLHCLDRREILKKERDEARRHYGEDYYNRDESIAFGSRIAHCMEKTRTQLSQVDSSCRRTLCSKDKRICDSESKAKNALQRSTMQYKYFDWSSMPSSEERRLNPDASDKPIKILTVNIK